MSTKYTRITVSPDIGEALQVGAKAPFVVNLSQSISGVTIEELTKVSSEVKKDALSASNSAKAAKTSETNAKTSADNSAKSALEAKASADAAKISETNASGSATEAASILDELKSHSYDKPTVDSKLSGKVDKKGDTMTGPLGVITKLTTKSANGTNSVGIVSNNSGSGIIEHTLAGKTNNITLPNKSGTMLLEGDFGIGGRNIIVDEHLDTLRFPQIMQQPLTNKATFAKGYPFESAGVLEIFQTVNTLGEGCVQVYTDYIGNRRATRAYTGSTFGWRPWNIEAVGNYGLGATSNTGFVAAETPKDANSINYSGFIGGGGGESSNYFEAFAPLIAATRQGGDGTGQILQIQSNTSVRFPLLAYRVRNQNQFSEWHTCANTTTTDTQLFSGRIQAPVLDAIRGDDYFGLRVHSNGTSALYGYRNGSGFDYTMPTLTGEVVLKVGQYVVNYGANDWTGLRLYKGNKEYGFIETNSSSSDIFSLGYRNAAGVNQAIVTLPRRNGELMLAGDYGIGGSAENWNNSLLKTGTRSSLFRQTGGADLNQFTNHGGGIHIAYDQNIRVGMFVNAFTGVMSSYRSSNNDANGIVRVSHVWSSANTTVDSNGFIKRASPIIKISGDGSFELNEESEGANVVRLGIGHYRVTGIYGFNSDNAWGIDGGISIPKDHNDQPLIWLEPEVNPDGSVDIYTFHRENHIPENIRAIRERRLARMGGEYTAKVDGEPCDIPAGTFVDLRVEMPEDSIYNVKQRGLEEYIRKYEKYQKPIDEAWENKPEYISDAMDKFLNI